MFEFNISDWYLYFFFAASLIDANKLSDLLFIDISSSYIVFPLVHKVDGNADHPF